MAFTRTRCPDNLRTIESGRFCLASLSKDLRGEQTDPSARPGGCDKPGCKTLVSREVVRLEAVSHGDCDDELARTLDGGIELQLVHALNGDTRRRGYHYARFRWAGPGFDISGEMSGTTNAGVHREPAFKGCESCESVPIAAGRFCGEFTKARRKALQDARVFGIYRLDLNDPTAEGFEGPVTGTLEGVLFQPCAG